MSRPTFSHSPWGSLSNSTGWVPSWLQLTCLEVTTLWDSSQGVWLVKRFLFCCKVRFLHGSEWTPQSYRIRPHFRRCHGCPNLFVTRFSSRGSPCLGAEVQLSWFTRLKEAVRRSLKESNPKGLLLDPDLHSPPGNTPTPSWV